MLNFPNIKAQIKGGKNMPDNFRTDPSGNSGNKIACGIIQ